ncbi:MAG: ABC transporter permease [Ferruginibacter sp.]
MFTNYLKIALRNIRKNKLYSAVNIIGLTTALAGCILIGLFIWNELTYDNFQQHKDRIARVVMKYREAGKEGSIAVTGTRVGPQYKRSFPQVESYVRVMKYPLSLTNGQQSFEEKNLLYADEDFFKLFSFPFLEGNPATALNAPQKIVLTKKAAEKYFGKADPLGKTLRISGGTKDYEVTGITGDVPTNSQIQYDAVISFASTNAFKTEKWSEANYITYLLLKDKSQFSAVDNGMKQYMAALPKEELRISEGSSDYRSFELEPFSKVHLYSKVDGGLEPGGNLTYIYVLAIVALMILLIACVNYTNLATAQSVSRSTEIAVRKVLGARQQQLLKQFLGESFVITIIAFVLAILLSIVLLPLFNNITGKEFTTAALFRPVPLLFFTMLAIGISLLAGAYPAFVLSNTRLANILKSGFRVSQSGGGIRKGLIVFQFVISVFLLTTTLIVMKQVSYIQHSNIGYDRNQVLVLPVDYKTKQVYEPLKEALQQIPGVVAVTGAYEDPTSIGWGDGITADDGNGQKELSLNATPVDLDYLKTMGMQLAAGRDFVSNDFLTQDTSNDYSNYKASYILNEKAARDLGWTAEQAIGKTISRGSPGPVVGVVKDFHFQSLHRPVGPLLIFLDSGMVQQMFIKIRPVQVAGTIASIENAWKQRVSHRPFDYHFLDDDFNALYNTEQRTAKLFFLFASLAIVLACLGLFALAAYTTIQRTKEISIRKILGANVGSILLLIAKQFILLILIANIIAMPVAWWAGNQWLNDFAYRIDINWSIFAIAGIAGVAIALLTISYHAIRVALSNPVKSLRTE